MKTRCCTWYLGETCEFFGWLMDGLMIGAWMDERQASKHVGGWEGGRVYKWWILFSRLEDKSRRRWQAQTWRNE